jgi:hypothetical protein
MQKIDFRILPKIIIGDKSEDKIGDKIEMDKRQD